MPGLREPLALLYEADERPSTPLPEVLERSYGGALRLGESWTIANFVSSLDGVVAIPSETQSSSIVSDRSEADRFVMALLRAAADAIVIGSGTLRASPRSLWTAERVFPPASDELAEFRRGLSLAVHPQLAVLTASGAVDPQHPAFEDGAFVLTTATAAERIRDRLPEAAEVAALAGEGSVDVHAAVDLLRARGFRRILSEAGPTVMSSLLAGGIVEELFLTLSPLVAGRPRDEERPGFAEGVGFLPGTRIAGRLTGVRRHGAHLFLRYRLA